MLLWQTYKNRANGWVDLTPLTIVFMPDETVTDPVERWRHAVVMEVPEGANLRFDRPLDLNKGGIGRLIEGRLRGPVRIRSQGKRPDHQDDLLVLTHDVDLSEQRITTASDVDFQWGRNSGRGRQMEIKLLPRLGPRVANQEGPNIGGIEQIQFEHVERLHLDMGSGSAAAAQQGGPARGVAAGGPAGAGRALRARRADRHHLPRAVPLQSDRAGGHLPRPGRRAADSARRSLRPHGLRTAFDLLHAAGPAPGAAPPSKQSAPGFDLQPARIEAQGTPTTLTAPMDHLQARAETLQYNLIDGQIYLADTQEVVLQKDHNEIHTPSLRYTPGPPNHTGQFQLLAAGPGWLRGEMADRPGQQLEAHWREKLEARPQDQNQVISLIGGAMLNFQAMGQLDARDIHFWLRESPPEKLPSPDQPSVGARRGAGGEGGFQPDRLLAEGNVVGTSPQFSTKVERLEAWFTNCGGPSPTWGRLPTCRTMRQTGEPPPGGSPEPYVPSTVRPAFQPDARLSSLQSLTYISPLGGQDPAAAGGRQAHMEISGRLLQARVLLRDQQHGDLTEVTVFDNVKLQETQTALPGDLPLLVTGQWLHATEASSPQAKVTVKGEPAHMEGRGMSLTGPNIHIDRGANVLSHGRSRADGKSPRSRPGKPAPKPSGTDADRLAKGHALRRPQGPFPGLGQAVTSAIRNCWRPAGSMSTSSSRSASRIPGSSSRRPRSKGWSAATASSSRTAPSRPDSRFPTIACS